MAGGTRSFEIAKRLASKGYDVHVITTDRSQGWKFGWRESKEAGITVHWCSVPYSNSFGIFSRLLAFIVFAMWSTIKTISLRGDIIFATSTPLTVAIPALVSKFTIKTPFVFEVRDLWPDVPIALGVVRSKLVKRIAKHLEISAYKYSSHIIALAPGMKQEIIQKGISSLKISVVPNGCDEELLHGRESRIPAVYQFSDAYVVLYIGAIGLTNGVDYIVSLAEHTSPKFKFIVLGEGKLLDDVVDRAKSTGTLNQGVFFHPPVPKSQIPDWLAKCDATIMTYTGPSIVYRDSVSNKFFDSLAAGKPVLANFKGFSTAIAEQHNAGLILSNDISIASIQLERFLTDSIALSNASRNAKDLGMRYFSRDKQAEEIQKVLTDVFTTNKSNPSELSAALEKLWAKATISRL